MKLRLARKILSRNNSNKANYWNGYTHSSIESFIFFSKNERVRKALILIHFFHTMHII